MNLLLIVLFLGLGIRAALSFLAWTWSAITDAFNSAAPASQGSKELAALRPVDYFRVRSGPDPKVRTISKDNVSAPPEVPSRRSA